MSLNQTTNPDQISYKTGGESPMLDKKLPETNIWYSNPRRHS